MKYFRNTELAKLYHVSEKSVRNWIEASRDGKMDLELYDKDGKIFISNTSKNMATVEQLVQKGKKFKNTRAYKIVQPTPKFYDLYSSKQILDIISNLTIHHEIPTQYSYVDGAAKYWDDYAHRLADEKTPNILTKTVELLDAAADSVDLLIENHCKVNVIDLGAGNGLPIRSTLERLLRQGRLNRYVAIDDSKEMLHILGENIKTWFDGTVKFEGYVRDFSDERFDDLFIDDYLGDNANPTPNLVFLLGGTLSNFRSPSRALQTINRSLGLNDLLFYTGYLDTPNTRRYFDFNTNSRPNQKLRSELILGLLNIDESFYEIEQSFNEEKHARSGNFRPKVDLSIKFELPNGIRYVELRKDEPILLWRHWHKDIIDFINQFDQNGFDIMITTKSKSQEYLLLAAKLKTDN